MPFAVALALLAAASNAVASVMRRRAAGDAPPRDSGPFWPVLARGGWRTALLGLATGLSFAFTAALVNAATHRLSSGLAATFASWQPYAMATAGLCAQLLLQYCLRSGPLVIAQPALTTSDPIGSMALGAALFGEQVRTGPWIVPEAAGMALILYGSIRIAVARQGHDADV